MKKQIECNTGKGAADKASSTQYVTRFSISLPSDLLKRLDRMVDQRELPSRSHAIAEMIRQDLVEHEKKQDQRVMAGTITLVYSNERGALRNQLAQIQFRYLKEVISSQHVFLEDEQSLEVLLVQGPTERLQQLSDELRGCKGVKQARLVLTAAVLPPLH
jgi:CopG family nickel-responsive transcriptional regulator